MSQNDVILVGTIKFTVIKRDGHRALLSWRESTGMIKERWIIVKLELLKKAA